jgi:hypothetical protein
MVSGVSEHGLCSVVVTFQASRWRGLEKGKSPVRGSVLDALRRT